jgi:hypothetical protein
MSVQVNGREPKICLGRVFNFKLSCIVTRVLAWHGQTLQHLELETELETPPQVCPWHFFRLVFTLNKVLHVHYRDG